MFQFNRQVIKHFNNARTQPRTAAEVLYNNFKNRYKGSQLHAYDKIIDTFEGVEALQDFRDKMNQQEPVHALRHSRALDQAAQLIAEEKGREGKTQNQKPKKIYQKIQQFGKIDGKVGQLVSLCASTPDEITTYFMIDDGLASRKRRRMLLDSDYKYIGVGHAAHTNYQYITVILLAFIFWKIHELALKILDKVRKREVLEGVNIIHKDNPNIIDFDYFSSQNLLY